MDRVASVVAAAAVLSACAQAAPPLPMALTVSPPRIAARHGVVPEADLRRGLLQRLAAPVALPCTEQELPVAYRPAQGRYLEEKNLGRGLALTLPRGTVVARRDSTREVAVYLSNLLDPSSEVGDAGYRVVLADKNGTRKDASLGFAMFRPYVVGDNVALPILDGDVLQLAVDVQEVDDDSITFPPVGMTTRRTAADRMLRCPLAAVFRDSDRDGATDVEEARLGTDPGDADTDGDGIPDGADPAPLGASAATTPEDAVRSAVLREIVEKEMAGELLWMVTPGPRLDLRGVTFRVLQLRKDEAREYAKRFGMRVAFSLKVAMKGPDLATVDLDFSWRGESYTATRARGTDRWTFEESGGWISAAP